MNSIADSLYDLIKQLYPFDYSVCSTQDIYYLQKFLELLPFEISYYPSGATLNGWKIPSGWSVSKAQVYVDDKLVFDGVKAKMGCAYLSPSFHGIVSKETLIEHCSYRKDIPDVIVYDWTRLYRQGVKSWGLSIPWSILDSIPPDSCCETIIETEFFPYRMPVLSFAIKGQLPNEIILNAHNCHPYQANDDISGCAVAIKIFQDLLKQDKLTLYSYRLLIAPELFGPMFWLDDPSTDFSNIDNCLLLKSVGNSNTINVQQSFDGNSLTDHSLLESIKHNHISDYNIHPFRSYYGNDETVFEAPGFRIPTSTLTRYPFDQYHTSADDLSAIDKSSLASTYKIVWNYIEIIESNKLYHSPKPGLYCLSNPIYNLYKTAIEPGISEAGSSEIERRWNLLMNCLPMHFDKGTTTLQLSRRYNLNYFTLLEYLESWVQKKLVQSTEAIHAMSPTHDNNNCG